MARRLFVGIFGVAAWLSCASLSHAACKMDNDCAGDLVCEKDECVAPVATPAAPSAVAPTATTPVATAPAAAPATSSRGLDASPSQADLPPPEAPKPVRRGKRHSQSMMVGGIVLTSLAPIGLIVAELALLACYGDDSSASGSCGNAAVGGLAATGILLGVGIPLIVMGAHRDPEPTARIAPWVTPHSAGLGFRLEL